MVSTILHVTGIHNTNSYGDPQDMKNWNSPNFKVKITPYIQTVDFPSVDRSYYNT